MPLGHRSVLVAIVAILVPTLCAAQTADDCARLKQPIPATSIGLPSARFSGTKNPPVTNHWPTTTRLNRQNTRIAANGYRPIRPTLAAASVQVRVFERRTQTAPARATAVTGHASYRVRQANANTQPTTADEAGAGGPG